MSRTFVAVIYCVAAVSVIAWGYNLVKYYRTRSWLLTDARRGTATIRLRSFHRGGAWLSYDYEVNQQHYQGSCAQALLEGVHPNVTPGEQVAVYYSASHPWLSSLGKPTAQIETSEIVIFAFTGGLMVVFWGVAKVSRSRRRANPV